MHSLFTRIWYDISARGKSRCPGIAVALQEGQRLLAPDEDRPTTRLDSERGIAWRVADSLSLRHFLGYGLDQAPPDHSTISRPPRALVSRATYTDT
jgi:hypothetical protein